MNISYPSNIKPILRQVFSETIHSNNTEEDYIDLNDKKSGKPDGIKQSNELLLGSNPSIEGLERYDDDIVYFFGKNITAISQDKIQELVPLLFEYVQTNPMSGEYYSGESSFSAKEILGIIIAHEPRYLPSVNEFFTNNNFLVRWSGIGILALAYAESNNSLDFKEQLQILTDLYENEQNKKATTELPNIKTTYYQANELYNEYLNELKGFIDYFKAN